MLGQMRIVPVISDGQMKRRVRTGGGIRRASISVFSVRAISRFASAAGIVVRARLR